eukprot:gene34326-42335_t
MSAIYLYLTSIFFLASSKQIRVMTVKYISSSGSQDNGRVVIIGIKSFALHAEQRQAIRDTWIKSATTSHNNQGVTYLPFFIIELFVILCDDDVYVDINELSNYLQKKARSKQFYAGEVLETRMNHVFKPLRYPSHRNRLSVEQYPLSVLPPFALGNFYILSWDIAVYLAKNVKDLKSTGTLEDLSMGIWLMSLQVFATHMP